MAVYHKSDKSRYFGTRYGIIGYKRKRQWAYRHPNSGPVLQIFAYVAQTEREFIKQRQAEGIAAAKAKGTQFGRKKLEKPENFEDCFNRWEAGVLSKRKGAVELGVSHTTFHRWCLERKQNMEQSVSEGRHCFTDVLQ